MGLAGVGKRVVMVELERYGVLAQAAGREMICVMTKVCASGRYSVLPEPVKSG